MVTGLVSAAVQVAVTCVVGEADNCTDGSLAVQLELTNAAVAALQNPANLTLAENVWLFPGGAAVWFTVAVFGPTFMPATLQF